MLQIDLQHLRTSDEAQKRVEKLLERLRSQGISEAENG
jgi:hypothetical protein